MRWIGRARQVNAGNEHTQARAAARAVEADAVWQTAKDLLACVRRVSSEELLWQEAHYDHDSRLGRELLFLMANQEWARATSEIIDFTRSDTLSTTIKIDVDLSQVTHEAFWKRTGPIWLPIAVLPPFTAKSRYEPDLFATVTDAAGDPVPMLPAADLRHQISAAMAEIIAKMAVAHWPTSGERQPENNFDERRAEESPVATRDERLLLSAAIYRMLRDGSTENNGGVEPVGIEMQRIKNARKRLAGLLDRYISPLNPQARITPPNKETAAERQSRSELARRAVKVLQALSESIIMVVLANYTQAPSVLTVRVPTRTLKVSKSSWIKPWTWVIRPAGRLEIDVLLPTADADRQIQINLPAGVSIDEPRDVLGKRRGERPRMDISVHAPLPLRDLDAAVKQVFAAQNMEKPWPEPMVQSIIDLAKVKSALARDTLRHYKVRYRSIDEVPKSSVYHDPVSAPAKALSDLAADLNRQDKDFPARLQEAWQRFAIDKLAVSRRIVVDSLTAQTVAARANVIEDPSQRATPERATVYVEVTVDDLDYFSTARSSAFMSLILMVSVLGFLVGWHLVNRMASVPSTEVLAIVLTLFATIQADRIERPDRSTLRGRLFAIGSWLVAGSVLPSLTLAIALAFQPQGRTAYQWASGCIAAQLLFLVLMRRGPLTPTGWPRLGKRRVISTDRPSYRHFEALRSAYWRNTTAEALMIGRQAHGYVVWQQANPKKDGDSISPGARPLLKWGNEPPSAGTSSVLAFLRSGTLRQSVTFVVFRDKPPKEWPANVGDRRGTADASQVYNKKRVALDPGRLAPADSVTSTVDVFVGVYRHELLSINEHPLTIIIKAAKDKLIVLDTQLPVPAPVGTYDDRQWSRVRVALRDSGDIHRLTGFLDDIYREMAEPRNARHMVAVQTDPAARLLVIAGSAIAGRAKALDSGHEIPVLTSDLDIVTGAALVDESPQDKTWSVLAVCVDARSSIEYDILDRLASIRENFQLAGLTYALLHGTAVMILYVHEPPADRRHCPGAEFAPTGHDQAKALENALRMKSSCAGLRVPIYKQLCREDLEPAANHAFAMLRVRFRWQDRPGATLNVLNSTNRALIEQLPAIRKRHWSVSYARIQVLTGQIAEGRLTIRMHIPPQLLKDWNADKMEKMGRRIELLAAADAAKATAAGSSADGADKPEEPVVVIDRIKKTAGASEYPVLTDLPTVADD